MKIVFSPKGFDSSAGGGPSPIVDGVPVSLPIPAGAASRTSYADLGLGDEVERTSRGKIGAADLCHHDPMFAGGECIFGQCGAAQSHLEKQGVGPGDWFLFFGLFAGGDGDDSGRHHRLFGWMEVTSVSPLENCDLGERAALEALGHPHALAMHGANDCIWRGPGGVAACADPRLRLTVPGGPLSIWNVPEWLAETGLSYHGREDRWLPDNRLRAVSRGQEFVADVGDRSDAREWLARIIAILSGA